MCSCRWRRRGFFATRSGRRTAEVLAAFDALQHDNVGRDEMRYHGIWREDHKFGDAIFLADAGIQFAPSDMGVKPLNGMHGFDPADEDSAACCLSTVPVPGGVRRVCDYFSMMTG